MKKNRKKFLFNAELNRYEIRDFDGQIIGVLNAHINDKDRVTSIQLGEFGGYYHKLENVEDAIQRFYHIKLSHSINTLISVVRSCKVIYKKLK